MWKLGLWGRLLLVMVVVVVLLLLQLVVGGHGERQGGPQQGGQQGCGGLTGWLQDRGACTWGLAKLRRAKRRR